MGLFWDKLKLIFKGRIVVDGEKARSVDVAEWETQYKQSKAPAQLVVVGFGKEYNNRLAICKSKSQRANWKRWKRRI
jgi:hypothetical protein